MIRKLFSSHFLITQGRNLSTEAKNTAKEKYDLYAAVLIERLPIVSHKFNELEIEVMVK